MKLGGETGSIGDPSGKTEDRVKIEQTSIDSNLSSISSDLSVIVKNVSKVLSPKNPSEFENRISILNNKSWYDTLSLREFQREVFDHMRIYHLKGKRTFVFFLLLFIVLCVFFLQFIAF